MSPHHPSHSSSEVTLPTATYRFQLRPVSEKEIDDRIRFPAIEEKNDPGIRFQDVETYIPYLRKLGVSHVYLSPITTPVKGSEHFYDVTDYHTISEALGGKAGFEHMTRKLHEAGIKVIVDFVPNHMGIMKGQNAWWQDVLLKGAGSDYADYFDIFWDQNKGDRKVVLPFLGGKLDDLIQRYVRSSDAKGEHVGEGGVHPEFRVQQDKQGKYYFDYWGNVYPINEKGQAILREKGKSIDEINHEPDTLKKVLGVQHYRPVFWQEGLEQINYRRFFSINKLAGLRIEDDRVFQDVHRELKQWVQEGLVDGVRIDHVDGLREPGKYLAQLRQLLGDKVYITTEKILGAKETLPAEWNRVMQGTTGYDHMIAAGNLFTHSSDELSAAYRTFLGTEQEPSYADIAHASRLLFMEAEMKTEVTRFEAKLKDLVKVSKAGIDPDTLGDALKEVTAAFPVYRTYIEEGTKISETDRKVIQKAIDSATSHAESHAKHEIIPAIAFIGRVLNQSGFKGKANKMAHNFVMSYQQLTGPIIAKGTEDTAFYRYNLLRGAVEVGAELEHLGLSPAQFTEYLQCRTATTMNASSTHDNKLGEDARARAVTLSHIPGIWAKEADAWKKRFAGLAEKTAKGGKQITAEDMYLFFQVLVASYPLELLFDEAAGFQKVDKEKARDRYSARMQEFVVKALMEAKVNTSWILSKQEGIQNPDEAYAYEDTVAAFVKAVIDDQAFAPELQKFARKIAHMGANVSLSQRILQATAPGIPDIYQGSENWNLSLVDPDNRRTPDFGKLEQQLDQASNKDWRRLSEQWPDGVVKQVLTQRLLKLRQENPDLFLSNAPGELVPLTVYGPDHKETAEVVAFARIHGSQAAIIAVPVSLKGELFEQDDKVLGISRGKLSENLEIELPEALKDKRFIDTLRDGEALPVEQGRIKLQQAFREVPGVVLGAGLNQR